MCALTMSALTGNALAGTFTMQLGPNILAAASPTLRTITTTHTCANPNVPAGIDGSIYSETPTIAADMNWYGSTVFLVDLNSQGGIGNAIVTEPSGNVWLDQAAARTVRTARYTPEISNCVATAGRYFLQVAFTND
jgi:TonB family protein